MMGTVIAKFIREGYSLFIQFFKINKEERGIIRNQIIWDNIRRIFYISLLGILASSIEAAFFGLKLFKSTGILYHWREMIIVCHLSIIVSFTAIALLLYFFSIRPGKISKVGKICMYLFTLMLITMGTSITAIDQLVTSAITPFMVSCIITGLILLIPPTQSVILFITNYIIFYFCINITQSDPEVLISNQVNGITITAIGIFLSFILYNGYITRVLQQKVILEQNQKLIENNALKEKFFSIIAHDLRSPFNSILGFLDLLVTRIRDHDSKDAEKYAVIIKESADNAYKLLENLLEWSMSATGQLNFNPENIDIKEIINNKINALSLQAQAKSISLISKGPESVIVFADSNMLKTIFRNLITNAIKFTEPGGRVEISIFPEQGYYKFIVADTGVGIPKEILNKLFMIGSNVSCAGTAKEKGTGLGLLLCKEFVEKHGGLIWAESKPDHGSKFIFTIPIRG